MNADPELPTLNTRQNVQRPRKATNPLQIEPHERDNKAVDHVHQRIQIPRTYFKRPEKTTENSLFPPYLSSKRLSELVGSTGGEINSQFTATNRMFGPIIGDYGISTSVENMRSTS